MEEYDLEEQTQKEQFAEEDLGLPSKEARKQLKELEQYEKQIEKQNKLLKSKKVARLIRQNNMNYYECDNCGELFQEDVGSLIHKKEGEFAYCSNCLKILYPKYKKVHLFNSVKKSDFLNNHNDTQYFNRIY